MNNTQYAIIAFAVGTLIFAVFVATLIIFLIIHKKRQRHYLTEKVHLQHQYQSQLLQSRIEVQEQTFKHFSEEIHDNIGQVLALAKYHIYKIGNNAGDPGMVKDAQTSNELLSKAITDLRNISHTLNGNYISRKGLTDTIEQELAYVSSARNIECLFNVTGNQHPLGDEKELLIFRIIQEAIANAIKHGSASRIKIALSYDSKSLYVSIADNGTGFALSDDKQNGLGLINMKLRAGLLNGTFNIHSAPGNGTDIQLHINTAA